MHPPNISYCAEPNSPLPRSGLVQRLLGKYFDKRRNWLFADTVKGAKASATIYGIVEMAKANGLEPYAYLRTLLETPPYAKTVADFEAMLPCSTMAAAGQ